MKRPSFQFYPSDWLRDTALRTCSTGARGLWMDMICYMHEGTPYGHLKVGNKVILACNLAPMVGATLPELEGWLDELESAGVFDRTEDGTICSRRMIRDEKVRESRASGGKLGGNPALKVDQRLAERLTLKDNQIPTPSSSTSSSSSNVCEDAEEEKPTRKKKPFIPPTPKEVEEYAQHLGFPIDGEEFCANYEKTGWKLSKSPITSWKACVVTWKKNYEKRNPGMVVNKPKQVTFLD